MVLRAALLAGALAGLLGGCVFKDVREQEERLNLACSITGTAGTEHPSTRPIVVVLARPAADPKATPPWEIADHFVLERAGNWIFTVPAGRYALAAFEDVNSDLRFEPDEPALEPSSVFDCGAGAKIAGRTLVVPTNGRGRVETVLDIAKLQARSLESQLDATLGQLTATGTVAALSDERFNPDNGVNGMWRPYDFSVTLNPGVYFLQPYEAEKIPVLFVHGIAGTPRSFAPLVAQLDRTRFQPWIYYYPSGLRLDRIADHLAQTMAQLQVKYRFRRFAVVAHSMGGLVSRSFIQKHAQAMSDDVPLFMTIATPWAGHKAAAMGVEHAPAVVRVWYDMSPGSDFLRQLLAKPLPAGTAHHLAFTFNRADKGSGESSDTVITVASQLAPAAQQGATRLYGFDDTHVGVLDDPELSQLLNRLLAGLR